MEIKYQKQTSWEIVYSRYEGLQARAVQLLCTEMGYRVCRKIGVYELHVLPCRIESETEPSKCAVIIGLYGESSLLRRYIDKSEIPQNGYCTKIINNPSDEAYQYVLICAESDDALLHGAIDFIDCDCIRLNGSPMQNSDEVFDYTFPLMTRSAAPKTERRMVFTWGHPINDYRSYLRNMARIKINEVILWNVFARLTLRKSLTTHVAGALRLYGALRGAG